jgi:hypothetical protein
MRRSCSAGLVLLFISVRIFAQGSEAQFLRKQLDLPFAALFNREDLRFDARVIKAVRTSIEQEQDSVTHACNRSAGQLKDLLATSRKKLKALNEASARDNPTMSASRQELHAEITALEERLRDKQRECDHAIPIVFEVKLAKLDVLKRWPKRREEIEQEIEQGHVRQRTHGDIEDIGFRIIADGQEKDIAAGEQAIRQMSAAGLMPGEVRYSSVRQYVDRLAAKIAGHSDLKVPLHVTVVDSPEINVTALPGGFVFLTSGTVRACETEAELVGVLSQQIAHVAARHATRHSKMSTVSKMFVPVAQVATGLFTGGVGNAGAHYGMDLAIQGAGELTNRTLAGSNEKSQPEADQLGIQYAWNAGYDPMGFTSFLDSLASRSDYFQTSKILQTKPALSDRVLDAFTEIEYLPGKENYADSSAEFRAIQTLLQP